ncbi:MAG: hypothetical protein L3J75_12195 [Methylococcaceae bacterium]|nr:hypothetical protein [Methylococcaceae bacterium]
MKVFLDDEREPPTDWILVRWPEEAIYLLKSGYVEEISLDHDLGDDSIGTGYDVILWIEEQVALNKMNPPIIKVHSANTPARSKMLAGIKSIYKIAKNN